jgi:hypothetical protein
MILTDNSDVVNGKQAFIATPRYPERSCFCTGNFMDGRSEACCIITLSKWFFPSDTNLVFASEVLIWRILKLFSKSKSITDESDCDKVAIGEIQIK